MDGPKVEDHIPIMCQLRRAATLPPVEQNGMIAAIVFSMTHHLFNVSLSLVYLT